MPMPRLKISHQLSLLMAAVAVLAVLVVGGLSDYNLRSGFSDYLKVRDDEQLMRLVALIEQRAATDPDFGWLRDQPEAMRDLIDELTGRPARGQRPPPPRDFARRGPPDENGRDRPPPGVDGRPPPRGGGGAGNLGDRVLIRDREGRKIAGRPLPPTARTTVRAIKVNGQEVAFVDLMVEPPPEGVDALFLQRQTRQLWWAALASIVLAVGAAWWMAGRWSRPLLALQRASRDIARGQHTQPLLPDGALEIAQLMEDVNTMTAELARLEAARRVWIAQISHELRTPLSVLRGEMEAIEDGARQPTPQVMASLRDEVRQLNRLVDDLHTLSVADVDGLRCDLTPGDAHASLWRVVQRFSAQATQQGLVLRLPPESAPPISVHWDFGRIEQLVSNLLTNSLRYTDAPGSVVVDWRCEGHDVVITVDDSAPGVGPADLKELFEPLFRGDRARQRGDQHGSGLGLSIARSIAQAHQGSVTASASKLGGLQLCVRLPVRPLVRTE
jgi:two-component system sensor histidine kinase BaeS